MTHTGISSTESELNYDLVFETPFPCHTVLNAQWLFSGKVDIAALERAILEVTNTYKYLSCHVVDMKKSASGTKIYLSTCDSIPLEIVQYKTMKVVDVLRNECSDEIYFCNLQAKDIKGGRKPLLVIKIIILADGWILSPACSHLFADGNTYYTLINNLLLCYEKKPMQHLPELVLPTLPVKTPIDSIVKQRLIKNGGYVSYPNLLFYKQLLLNSSLGCLYTKLVKDKYFRIGPIKIKRDLIETIKANANISMDKKYSSNVILTGICIKVWLSLFNHKKPHEYYHGTPIDLRGRINSLSTYAAGSLSTGCTTGKYNTNDSFETIINKLTATFTQVKERPSKFLEQILAIEWGGYNTDGTHHEHFFSIDQTAVFYTKPIYCWTNNFCHLPIYGHGISDHLKPISVFPHSLGDIFLIWPSKDLNEYEIYLSGATAKRARTTKRVELLVKTVIDECLNYNAATRNNTHQVKLL